MYQESLLNVAQADVNYGKDREIIAERNLLEEQTLDIRHQQKLHAAGI